MARWARLASHGKLAGYLTHLILGVWLLFQEVFPLHTWRQAPSDRVRVSGCLQVQFCSSAFIPKQNLEVIELLQRKLYVVLERPVVRVVLERQLQLVIRLTFGSDWISEQQKTGVCWGGDFAMGSSGSKAWDLGIVHQVCDF